MKMIGQQSLGYVGRVGLKKNGNDVIDSMYQFEGHSRKSGRKVSF